MLGAGIEDGNKLIVLEPMTIAVADTASEIWMPLHVTGSPPGRMVCELPTRTVLPEMENGTLASVIADWNGATVGFGPKLCAPCNDDGDAI